MIRFLIFLGAAALCSGEAGAQTTLDRVDPARVEKTLPKPPAPIATLPAAPVAPPAAATVAVAGPVTIGAVALRGLVALRAADFADVIETYVGRTLSPAALAGLADAVSERARARGYLFATAAIPPQTLAAGTLAIDVDEGRIDEVRIVGTANAAAQAALDPLAGAGPVTAAQLQRRLLLAGDVDGTVLRQARLVREGARAVLLVGLGEKRISGVVDLDNTGTRPIGPLRADASVRIAQLFAPDDSLTLIAATVPLMPSELAYGRARYAKRIDRDGTEVSAAVSYATVAPGSYLEPRDIVGRSWTAQVAVTQPLLRRRAASWWAQASFDVRSVKQDASGQQVRRDRISSARIGVYGYATTLGGVLRASATLSQGVGLFGATGDADPFASRSDASGRYTSLAANADWTVPVAGPPSTQVAVAGQIAGEPLLIAEEFGLGGVPYMRPYDYNERSGDDGVVGTGELRYAVAKTAGPLRQPLLYVFASGGYADNLRGGVGGGSLFAGGGGVRSGIGQHLTADAGVAFPLSGPRYDTGNDHPVFNFRLARRF